MNKDEFLRQLEVLLSRISQRKERRRLHSTAAILRTPGRQMRQRY